MMKSQPLISDLPFSFVSFSGLSFLPCYLPSRCSPFYSPPLPSFLAVFVFSLFRLRAVTGGEGKRRSICFMSLLLPFINLLLLLLLLLLHRLPVSNLPVASSSSPVLLLPDTGLKPESMLVKSGRFGFGVKYSGFLHMRSRFFIFIFLRLPRI